VKLDHRIDSDIVEDVVIDSVCEDQAMAKKIPFWRCGCFARVGGVVIVAADGAV
jgi:hypothetical protein